MPLFRLSGQLQRKVSTYLHENVADVKSVLMIFEAVLFPALCYIWPVHFHNKTEGPMRRPARAPAPFQPDFPRGRRARASRHDDCSSAAGKAFFESGLARFHFVRS